MSLFGIFSLNPLIHPSTLCWWFPILQNSMKLISMYLLDPTLIYL